jgi:O-6-methylguanine DNA methyltransferase
MQIPYGETKSYQQIAMVVGNDKACRAVGMANNHNPIMIVIPCHRVIGADGTLTGYADGLEMKKYLLDLENS